MVIPIGTGSGPHLDTWSPRLETLLLCVCPVLLMVQMVQLWPRHPARSPRLTTPSVTQQAHGGSPSLPAWVRLPSEVLHFQASGHTHLLVPLPRPHPRIPLCQRAPLSSPDWRPRSPCPVSLNTRHSPWRWSGPVSSVPTAASLQAAGVRPQEGPPPHSSSLKGPEVTPRR